MFYSDSQKIIVFITILLTSTIALPNASLAQQVNLKSEQPTLLAQRGFSGFSQRYGVAPRRRSTPFRRGSCLPPQAEMTALFPTEDVITESSDPQNWGNDRTWFTNEAYPTIYFHMPQNSASTAEVVIEDSDRNIVYSAIVSLPDQGNLHPQGFLGVDFSDKAQELNIPTLDPNETYLWEVQLICDNLDRSGNPLVTGWITRLDQAESEEINQIIEQEDTREIPWTYAQQGIWYSTLNSLAHNYINNSNNEDWKTFLEAIGYNEIASDPFLGMAEVEAVFLGDLPTIEF